MGPPWRMAMSGGNGGSEMGSGIKREELVRVAGKSKQKAYFGGGRLLLLLFLFSRSSSLVE